MAQRARPHSNLRGPARPDLVADERARIRPATVERWVGDIGTTPRTFLARFADPAYTLLRIVSGALFAAHGAQKLFGVMGGERVTDLASLPGAAGVIELVAGTLIAIGLVTSWAAFLASGEMAVAYFIAHAPRGPSPLENGGELAALYAFLFLFLAARGAGMWSVAAALDNPKLA